MVLDGQVLTIPHAPGPPVIWLTALTSMFMHGGFGHLAGNLLYLWIFGDNVEHRFGHRVFLGFYLVSGIAATALQVSLNPGSIIPTLGASGAISGVLGAYMVLFPRNRVNALLFVWVLSIPAFVAIGLWIVFQIVSGWSALLMPTQMAGGVAYGAHIGGFAAGVLLALVLRTFIKEERPGLFSKPIGR
jgi:membrane associated rhomboid family serine protease